MWTKPGLGDLQKLRPYGFNLSGQSTNCRTWDASRENNTERLRRLVDKIKRFGSFGSAGPEIRRHRQVVKPTWQ
jgi:hypothetical protein